MSNTKLEPIQNGSNYPFQDKMISPRNPRNAFNWSHDVIFTLPNGGLLMPVMCSEVLPGSEYRLSAKTLIRVLPQVVPLYSKQRYYLQAFYCRYSDLWKSADVYMTKGYSGNRNLTKPVLNESNLDPSLVTSGSVLDYEVKAGDLFHCMGLQVGKTLRQHGPINALPFMMYEKIYNSYFMNRNLYINDRVRLPDDLGDFRLKDDGTISSNSNSGNGVSKVLFGNFHYRDWALDYFTTSLPFQQRGDSPKLNFNVDVAGFNAYFSPLDSTSLKLTLNNGSDGLGFVPIETLTSSVSGTMKYSFDAEGGTQVAKLFYDNPSGLSKGKLLSVTGSSSSISGGPVRITPSQLAISGGFTLDEFRNLAIAQQELERMARTDGSFREFGLTFFGMSSRNSIDYVPTFIGGTFQQLIFSEVVQTSQSSSQSPLGTYAGHGIISDNGNLGQLRSDEHGYIMVLLSIMPDTYYAQGKSKMFDRLTQTQEFLPGRDKLGLTPIYNKELYVSGDDSVDNDLFAHQSPFDEYRYKENRIIGKIADPSNNSFSPYTQARFFGSTPTYSKEFFIADDIRKDYLAAPTEDAYSGSISFHIRAVEPLAFNGDPVPVI